MQHIAPWRLCPGAGIYSIIISGVLLAFMGLGMLLLMPVQQLGKEQQQIRAYLTSDTSKQQATELATDIASWHEVKSATTLDKELAWQEYARHSGVPEDTFPTNPLPQILLIELYDQQGIKTTSTKLAKNQHIELILSDPPWAGQMKNTADLISLSMLIIILLLIKIIRDSINLGILRREQQIKQGSILLAGLWIGLTGGILGCALIQAANNIIKETISHNIIKQSMQPTDFGYILILSCMIGLLAAAMPPVKRIK